ncbi:MAG: SpoIID/LytB domain-containing protein [Actinobacteria bacterium]|nr:MAG: SpoIID/LytB domain-containing protein [Actinomycetota bacterium]
MRRTALAAFAAAAAVTAAAPAHAASTFTIKGAGYGHGVGMSQFGALGYAQHGAGYRDILSHYYTGTSLGQAPDGAIVRVLLRSPRIASFTGATKAGDRPLKPDKIYRVAAELDGSLQLLSAHDHKLATFPAPLQVTSEQPITLRGPAANGLRDGAYRGWLEFRPGPVGNVLAMNALGLEQYVAGVVSAESPSAWPAAALQAQAVAARTYALTTNAGGALGFDQYADTRSQMYRGVAAETPATNAAVNATRGQVVTYAGRLAVTYFFSTSGGRTENVEESVMRSAAQPWLRSVDDPYDNVSPWHRWNVRMTMGQAAKKLRGLLQGKFRGVVVLERGASPRVVAADIVGSKGRTRVDGAMLRKRLGLRDTWAFFTAISSHKDNPDAPPPPGDEPTGGTPPAARAAADTGGVLAGRIVPVRAGAEVRVQRRIGGRWRLAATTLAGRAGAYRTTVPGPGLYRVVAHGAIGPVVRISR